MTHVHAFTVDGACECGIMLSALVRGQAREIRELRAERDDWKRSAEQVDATLQREFPDWNTVQPPFGVPLTVFLIQRFRAECERAQRAEVKLAGDVMELRAAALKLFDSFIGSPDHLEAQMALEKVVRR